MTEKNKDKVRGFIKERVCKPEKNKAEELFNWIIEGDKEEKPEKEFNDLQEEKI